MCDCIPCLVITGHCEPNFLCLSQNYRDKHRKTQRLRGRKFDYENWRNAIVLLCECGVECWVFWPFGFETGLAVQRKGKSGQYLQRKCSSSCRLFKCARWKSGGRFSGSVGSTVYDALHYLREINCNVMKIVTSLPNFALTWKCLMDLGYKCGIVWTRISDTSLPYALLLKTADILCVRKLN